MLLGFPPLVYRSPTLYNRAICPVNYAPRPSTARHRSTRRRMRLEEQMASLGLAKRLKELGVRQESLYCWYEVDGKPQLLNAVCCDAWNLSVPVIGPGDPPAAPTTCHPPADSGPPVAPAPLGPPGAVGPGPRLFRAGVLIPTDHPCIVFHRGPHPSGLPGRLYRVPDRCLGYPAGPRAKSRQSGHWLCPTNRRCRIRAGWWPCAA